MLPDHPNPALKLDAAIPVSSAIADVDVAQRARRHTAPRLLPFLFILYIVAFLERMNVGAAGLQMPGDLGFSDRVIGLGSGIFFLGYVLLEIPGALIAERRSARRWIARIMIRRATNSLAKRILQKISIPLRTRSFEPLFPLL